MKKLYILATACAAILAINNVSAAPRSKSSSPTIRPAAYSTSSQKETDKTAKSTQGTCAAAAAAKAAPRGK